MTVASNSIPLRPVGQNPWSDNEDEEPLISPNARSVRQAAVWLRQPKLEDYFPRLEPWMRYRLVPGDFVSLTFALLLLSMTILVLVGTIHSLLDLDKYALPWRSYCALSVPLPSNLDALPEVGVFVGVMSVATEAGFRRREMIRSTWAAKGQGGERTVVKFVVGQVGGEGEKELEMENQVYGDIIQLPIEENMNGGKTYAYFSWAYDHALVPALPSSKTEQVRPEYAVKADDDSFVVLGELEARLRVAWYEAQGKNREGWGPLVYWGYLVKDYFMAGELYALSWSLVEYVAKSEKVRGMTTGYEDQQVAKWIQTHPHASQVRWSSERCWVYNHPRSGTVYSHGFLFPSEVERVKKAIGRTDRLPTLYLVDSPEYSWSSVTGPAPRFKLLASSKLDNLTVGMRVEALVEGSALSRVLDANSWNRDQNNWNRVQEVYDRRETRAERYLGKDLGGTVVVHYLKRDEWFLETAAVLFGSL